jgi:hypothetical protein
MNKTDYHLTLRPVPDKTDPEGIRRLRRLLKLALRACGLRCVGVRTNHEPQESTNLKGSDNVE